MDSNNIVQSISTKTTIYIYGNVLTEIFFMSIAQLRANDSSKLDSPFFSLSLKTNALPAEW